ncbi:MAG TPA: hypothetical protein V6D50_14570 [Chroococcales cyanobacterium]
MSVLDRAVKGCCYESKKAIAALIRKACGQSLLLTGNGERGTGRLGQGI